MELNKISKSLKLSIMFLLTLFAISFSNNLSDNTVKAADYNLSAVHTYSDLYASIIFSNGNEGSASSANLGFNQIARYPNATGSPTSSDRYGVLTSSPNKVSTEGVKLTRLLATYNEYSWLVSKQSNVDGNIIENAYHYIWSNGILDKAEEVALGFVLNNAVLGANIYEGADGFIRMFEKMMLNLDIPTAFRLRTALSSSNAGSDDTFNLDSTETTTSKGLIHDAIGNLLTALDIDEEFYRIIQSIIWTFMIMGSLIMIMNLIRKAQLGQAMTTLNRIFVRVIVVFFCIDGSLMIQNIVKDMSNSFSNNFTSTLDFSKSIVSDSLLWAGTQNLSFAELGPVQGGADENSIGKVITTFKPTYENVKKINSKSIEIAVGAEIDEYTNTSTKTQQNDATKFIKALVKQKVFSVNDYFKIINNVSENKGSGIAASSNWLTFGQTIKAGDNYSGEKYYKTPGSVVFMQERADIKLMTESEIESVKQAMLYYNRKNVKSLNDPNSEEFKKAQKVSNEFETVTIGSTSWPGATNTKLNAAVELILPYNEISPFKYKFVTWNEVESYIYGATTTNSKSTADYNNYIHGAGSLQNNNPTNGSDDFSNIKEIDGDGTPDKSDEDSHVKKMLNTNSLAIAIYNRFGGIKGGGNLASLSTQSTAFLLQTNIKDNGITYYGYNTSYSKSDKGTPKQGQGITYVRYVIPNSGPGDLMMRASMLGLIWIVTGIAAAAGAFYLIKAPVFAALLKMTSSFFSAFFTGNLSALLEYLAYYAAIAFSFGFARMGIYIASSFGSYVIENLPGFIQGLLTASTSTTPEALITSTVNAATDWSTAIPSLGVIAFSILVAVLMVWPVAEVRVGARNARPRRVGLIGFIVMLPYMLAESFEEYLDAIHYKLYGKSKRQTFGSKFSNQFNAVDQGQLLKDTGGKALSLAGKGVAGALTGGAVGAALAIGKSFAGSALNKLTGQNDPSVDENGNPIDEKGSVVEDLMNSKKSRAAKLFGATTSAINGATNGLLDKAGLTKAGNWLNEQQDLAEADDETFAKEAIRKEQNQQEIDNAKRTKNQFGVDTMPNRIDRELTEDEENLARIRREERLSERLTGDRDALYKVNKSTEPVQPKEVDQKDDREDKEVVTNNQPTRVGTDVKDDMRSQIEAEYHRMKYGDDSVEFDANGKIIKLYDVTNPEQFDDEITQTVNRQYQDAESQLDLDSTERRVNLVQDGDISIDNETVEKLVTLKQDGKLDDIDDEEIKVSQQPTAASAKSINEQLLDSSLKQQAILSIMSQHLARNTQPQVSSTEKVVNEKVVEKSVNDKIIEKHSDRIEQLKIDPQFMQSKAGAAANQSYDKAVNDLNQATQRIESIKKATNNNTDSELYKNALKQQEIAINAVKQAQQGMIAAATPQTGFKNLVDGLKAASQNKTNFDALSRSAVTKHEKIEKLKVEREELVKQGVSGNSDTIKSKSLEITKLENELDHLANAMRKAQRSIAAKQAVDTGVTKAKQAASSGRQVLGDLSALANGRDHFMTKALKGELNTRSDSGNASSRAQDEANRRLDEIARTLEESNRLRELQMGEQRYRNQ